MDAFRSLSALWLMLLCSGCCLTAREPFWREPGIPNTQTSFFAAESARKIAGSGFAELELAAHCDAIGSPDATQHYLHALEAIWPCLEASEASAGCDPTLWHLYHQSLARLLVCAQRHQQYVPGTGIVLHSEHKSRIVPIQLVGLSWTPADLQQLTPVGDYYSPVLTRSIKRCGVGVPLVASRTCPTGEHSGDQYLPPGVSFAVTAILRTNVSAHSSNDAVSSETILEFHNPLASATLPVANKSQPLAADLSAPFAFQQVLGSHKADPFEWFIHPEMGDGRDGLFFLEPYQPGKIPVVLIHGLLSSPSTWVDMANELRNLPGFSDRFQIWGFRYATGRPFVASAAILRQDLNSALYELQQSSPDAALNHIVLVGHSMGGLIAKAQITFSNDELWNSVANRPLSEVQTDWQTREQLRERFYFGPQPAIRRVVFVATPHGGSTLATRLVGQIGSCLVAPDQTNVDKHRQLISDNPGVFSHEVSKRLPTSIDLLESRSHVLQAFRRLPVNCNVKLHSIIGNGCYSPGEGVGDGVVGVDNAQHPGVLSEIYVPASHTEIHRRPETICEIWRILCEHYNEYVEESHGIDNAAPDENAMTPAHAAHREFGTGHAAIFRRGS